MKEALIGLGDRPSVDITAELRIAELTIRDLLELIVRTEGAIYKVKPDRREKDEDLLPPLTLPADPVSVVSNLPIDQLIHQILKTEHDQQMRKMQDKMDQMEREIEQLRNRPDPE